CSSGLGLRLCVCRSLYRFDIVRSSRCRGCGSSHRALATRITLSDSSRLAAELSEVVKLCATYTAMANHFDPINNAGVKRKDALDSDAEARLPHCNRLAHPRMLSRNHDPFEGLNAFLVAFLDPDMNTDGVSSLKFGNIITQLTGFDTLDC